MALFIGPNLDPDEQRIPIAEAIGLMEGYRNFEDREKWHFVANLLHRSHGEVEFLEAHIKRLFENEEYDKISDGYRSNSLALPGSESFRVRINRWRPVGTRPIDNYVDIGLSYGIAHNHDFQLITKGIFGDGYRTKVFKIKSDACAGAVGEPTKLHPQGEFQLCDQSVIWFEAFEDIHIQIPPDDESISFNLIPTERNFEKPQLFFDTTSSTVSGFPENSFGSTLSYLDLMASLNSSQEVSELLVEIAMSSRSRWFRTCVASILSRRLGMEYAEALDKFELAPEFRSAKFDSEQFSTVNIR